jgi:L-alanine-DL-glutamate epimerase-like enolase superfamily enzyme
MEIAGARADKVRIPFRRPFLTSTGLWVERDAWILQLVDREGRVGLGEAVLEPRDGETAEVVLDQLVREAVESADDGGLPDAAELERHGTPGRALRAAIDAARADLSDAQAARTEPGGEGVGVNATIASVGPSASAQAALQALEAGFRTVKLKAGAERETEALVERIRAVRGAVGPDVRVRIDANGAWDAATARDRLAAIERFGIEYVEEPLAGGDPADLAALRNRVGIPIAADESVASPRAARDLVEARGVDLLVVKLSRVGGPDAAREIASLAADAGLPVVLSTLFETGVGVAAALAVAASLPEASLRGAAAPPDHGLATAGLLEHDLLRHALVVDAGRMRIPVRDDEDARDAHPGDGHPGSLGIVLDGRALRRYARVSIGGAGR